MELLKEKQKIARRARPLPILKPGKPTFRAGESPSGGTLLRQRPVSRRRFRARIIREARPAFVAETLPGAFLRPLVRGLARALDKIRAAGLPLRLALLSAPFALALVLFAALSAPRGLSAADIVLPEDGTVEMILAAGAFGDAAGIGIDEEDAAPTEPVKLTPAVGFGSYTVKKGDTVDSIARRFKLKKDSIISVNALSGARSLAVGRVLRVPSMDGLLYTARRGDNYGKIALRFGVKQELILDANEVSSEMLRVGQALFIPGARLSGYELKKAMGELFVYPTRGTLTSSFGSRPNPMTGVAQVHYGIDLANGTGTRIGAAMEGKVAMTGYNANFGNFIIISHPDGYQTLYGHLSKILVSKGQSVAQGEQIGLMGNTGFSTGSHLHFAIYKNGKPLDPLKYLTR